MWLVGVLGLGWQDIGLLDPRTYCDENIPHIDLHLPLSTVSEFCTREKAGTEIGLVFAVFIRTGVGEDGLGGEEDCIETERSSRQSIIERTSLFADDTTGFSCTIVMFADDVTAGIVDVEVFCLMVWNQAGGDRPL